MGDQPEYRKTTTELGKLLCERSIDLVYGGGSTGLMGVLANAVLDNGGQATGVIPDILKERELAHTNLSKLFVVGSMHERKAMMERLSSGFIALPGGLGTLEEFFEILTWFQLGLHQKPCGLLNALGYYDELLSFIEGMRRHGFLGETFIDSLIVDDQPSMLLDKLNDRAKTCLEISGDV
jgi:uncharacterized protein (TIGR00730 family)